METYLLGDDSDLYWRGCGKKNPSICSLCAMKMQSFLVKFKRACLLLYQQQVRRDSGLMQDKVRTRPKTKASLPVSNCSCCRNFLLTASVCQPWSLSKNTAALCSLDAQFRTVSRLKQFWCQTHKKSNRRSCRKNLEFGDKSGRLNLK